MGKRTNTERQKVTKESTESIETSSYSFVVISSIFGPPSRLQKKTNHSSFSSCCHISSRDSGVTAVSAPRLLLPLPSLFSSVFTLLYLDHNELVRRVAQRTLFSTCEQHFHSAHCYSEHSYSVSTNMADRWSMTPLISAERGRYCVIGRANCSKWTR